MFTVNGCLNGMALGLILGVGRALKLTPALAKTVIDCREA